MLMGLFWDLWFLGKACRSVKHFGSGCYGKTLMVRSLDADCTKVKGGKKFAKLFDKGFILYIPQFPSLDPTSFFLS